MSVRIIVGDALAALRALENESVQVCVTSPPYYGLRDYGVDGQIGMEQTPAAYLTALLAVFEEVKRVLRPDGLCFVNIGDSYAGSGKGPTGHNGIGDQRRRQGFIPGEGGDQNGARNRDGLGSAVGSKSKDLLLIPQRFAIAMQDAGWYVRSQIVWAKTSAMPESVRDRPTSAWEPIWMFAKSRTYFYDAETVAQPSLSTYPSGNGYARPERLSVNGRGQDKPWQVQPTSALRNVWLLGPEPSREEHYAAFPTEIPKRCILAGTSEKGACPACGAPWRRITNEQAGWAPTCQCGAGAPVPQTVLDPFLGSGTTALVADRLGRHAIGIELSPTYAEMAQRRFDRDAPMLSEPAHLDTSWQQPDLFAEAGS